MVFQANLDRHVGGGSRIDGLVAHITTFRKIEVLDVRGLPNLGGQVDLPPVLGPAASRVATGF